MKKLTLTFILLLTSLSFAENIKIATFNCFWLSQEKFTKRGDNLDFNNELKKIAKHIKLIDADIIGLTEIDNKGELLLLLNELKLIGLEYKYHIQGSQTYYQSVVLLSKIPIEVPRDKEISDYDENSEKALNHIPGRKFYIPEADDPDDQDDTGISKGLYTQLKINGVTTHLYVAHLASEISGKQDAQRVAQASLIRRHYLSRVQKGEHVIVMGDLNDGRGQPAIIQIRGLNDIYQDLIQTGSEQYAVDASKSWTYMFKGVRSQLDHILVSRSLKNVGKIKSSVLETPKEISDHRPFIVEFNFSN